MKLRHPFALLLVAAAACTLHGGGARAEIVLKPSALPPTEEAAEEDAPTLKVGPSMRRRLAALNRLADGGDVTAMLQLGLTYYRGENVGRSYGEAYRQFQKAAVGGDLRAALAAGYLLAKGLGVARNPGDARAWFGIASQSGYPRGLYLQSVLEDDIASPQSKLAARDLLERAAAGGDPIAANTLGVAYERNGQTATARLWYQQAANAGSETATRNLERLGAAAAATPREDVLRNLREKSAAGDAAATYELAGRYHRGDGVAVDYGEAVRLYRLAARSGNVEAQRMLSLILSRSTSAEPISPAWMLELSRMTLPQGGRADGRGDALLDDPLQGLLELKPLAAIPAATAAQPSRSAIGLSATPGVVTAVTTPAPGASAAPPPSNPNALSRARRLRADDGH